MNFEDHETKKILSLIGNPKLKILDVGCGLGRFVTPLSATGHEVFGIDKNPDTVKHLRAKGQENIFTFKEGENKLTNDFDLIIMSHIIEHIQSQELIPFFDKYLGYLKIGGTLIIATPFLHKRFFNDYDHVKPYTPYAISSLFSGKEQFQEKPRHRLKIENVWIRKDPIELELYSYMGARRKAVIKGLNQILIFIYRLSNKLISERTGWVGIFTRKG